MGTRADFYIGLGKDGEWLGSIAFDGYPESPSPILAAGAVTAITEGAFRLAVAKLMEQDDATTPEKGWPWPWTTSETTDFAYWFDKDHVHVCGWPCDDDGNPLEPCQHLFPDMSARQNVTFGKRSGLMILKG